jgi:hypothetical protein
MSSQPTPSPNRCQFIDADNRRCRSFRAEGHASLCLKHWRRERDFEDREYDSPEAKAIVAQVLGTREQFKTATQVNEALGKIFALRGRKLISIRDAAYFTYACQLMLFSLASVEREFTSAYELKEWEKLIERALRAHSANLPPLSVTNPPRAITAENPSSPKIVFEMPPSASSESVGGPSFPSGKGGDVEVDVAGVPVDVDSPRQSKSHRRKKKRRPAPKTGREFAIQVFDDLLEDRAARKQRTIARFGKEIDRFGEKEDGETPQDELIEGEEQELGPANR